MSSMKIFVAEELAQPGVLALLEAGHILVHMYISGDALGQAIMEEQPQVLIVRSTRVTKEVIDASRGLELIVRAGAGFDTIDVAHASSKGIFVLNCPGKNSAAVAELSIGLILAIDRRIPDNVIDIRRGRWDKVKYSQADGVAGKTLGIIGQGNIAREVIIRAKGLQMNIVAWSRSLTEPTAKALGVERMKSILDVASAADIISLHVAATADTKCLADRTFFEAMKDNAIFINTTRGSVVDEVALRWALDNKGIRAGLDVFNGEPTQKEGPCKVDLAGHPNVYITHHIGASTNHAQDLTAMEAARIVVKYANESVPDNCVNMCITPMYENKAVLTVRHVDAVGVIAEVLGVIRSAGWSVKSIQNDTFQGGRVASVRLVVDRLQSTADSQAVISKLDAVKDVLVVSCKVE